jgi:hypothetical protein
MFNRIHQKLGTAGFIISIVALVAALGGGAYAASGGLTGKQKKEVEKIAKSVSKPGKTGATGATGPAGAAGTAGAKGDTGATGTAGTNGTNGVGTPGKEGSPWTAGGTLPSGKTESGNWAYGPAEEGTIGFASIAFGIPLTSAPTFVYVEAPGEEEESCPGTAAEPKAKAGVLCLYQAGFKNATILGPEEVSPKNGALFAFQVGAGESGYAYGSWAVTAP